MRDFIRTISFIFAVPPAVAAPVHAADMEEIVVWGQETHEVRVNPASVLTPRDFGAINAATTEDLVKFEPSLVIRRRFIGDANGTMGIRGSNMFQTSRSMVFADGVPLHYLLQSRWNGAPRWNMVSASEIASVEVLYGPFSAAYGGNSMGGVVLVESAIPQQREFHFDSAVFVQDFNAYGFDDTLAGYKSFVSYGDKIGATSFYLSYNRLDNKSQPQTFYYGAPGSTPATVLVSGAIPGSDELGKQQLWFGDTGINVNGTANYKLKMGYERGAWSTLLNVAFESRDAGALDPNSYLRTASGATIWSGLVEQNGNVISVPAARLGVNTQVRNSLSLGLRVRGDLSENISLEANFNRFDVLRDEMRASLANPADPRYTGAGQLTDFQDTGWSSAETRLRFANVGVDDLDVVMGARNDAYELNVDVFDTTSWRGDGAAKYHNRSGGKTAITAAFVELDWDFHPAWNLVLGGRYETFASRAGYYSKDDAATAEFDLMHVPARGDERFSPKFSLGFVPADDWNMRYSVARAFRFPIVEELFSQYQAYNTISVANPELAPEDGQHHNVSVEHFIGDTEVRVNLFHESIEDVIEAQSTTLPGGISLNTFIPLDEVETRGLEFIVNSNGFLFAALDMRFNVAWTRAEIVKNAAQPLLEGNIYPRMPKWRSNILATWHFSNVWDLALNWQYAGDSYGRLDNADHANGVFGAQDAYSRVGVKSAWRFANGFSLGAGVDNLTNAIAYVAHPWPARSYYFNLAYDFR